MRKTEQKRVFFESCPVLKAATVRSLRELQVLDTVAIPSKYQAYYLFLVKSLSTRHFHNASGHSISAINESLPVTKSSGSKRLLALRLLVLKGEDMQRDTGRFGDTM